MCFFFLNFEIINNFCFVYMDSESDFNVLRKRLVKKYLQEALALCISCLDLKIDDPCSMNCSQQYISFLYGKKLLEQKFSQCKNTCFSIKTNEKNKDCFEICLEKAKKDIISLDNLLKL